MFRILACGLIFLLSAASAQAEPGGPDTVPASLEGTWKVSLCISEGHCWIRYQHVQTGQVHTVGRYAYGVWIRRTNKETGEKFSYFVSKPGLQWDLDLIHEKSVARKKFLLLSVLIENPAIPRGARDGAGHGFVRMNCTTYARDAWKHYSGEWYELPVIAAPDDLLAMVIGRHPEVKPSAQRPSAPE